MMSKIRRIDFSPDEWLAGTLTMKADERGCYITICALIYSNGGPILDSDRDIVRACNVTPERWSKIKAALIGAGKIVATGGMISNRRCKIELEKARNRTERARENGASGGVRSGKSRRKSAGNRGEIALNSTGNPSEIEPNSEGVSCKNNAISEADALLQNEANHQPSTTNYQESEGSKEPSGAGEFECWYAKYPRHIGRGQALRAYKAARRKTDAETLLTAAAAFAASVLGTDEKFIPHPATWLVAERWLDRASSGQPAAKPRPQAADWDFSNHA